MLPYEKYRRQMIDTVLALLPLLAMACYYYGPRVLIMAAISVGSAAAADYFCLLLQGERWWCPPRRIHRMSEPVQSERLWIWE